MSRGNAAKLRCRSETNTLTDTSQARLQTKLLKDACRLGLVQATKQATLYVIVDLRTARSQTRF